MRTTITFEPDVAAALAQLRREGSSGVSEIVNDLIRAGLRKQERHRPFVQSTAELGLRLDVSNVGEALELLDGPDYR